MLNSIVFEALKYRKLAEWYQTAAVSFVKMSQISAIFSFLDLVLEIANKKCRLCIKTINILSMLTIFLFRRQQLAKVT